MKWVIPGSSSAEARKRPDDGGHRGPGGFLMFDAAALMARRVPPEPLVHPFLHRGSVAILGGYSASFKTWLAMALAVSVSAGKPWLGEYACRKSAVAYLSWEGNFSVLSERFKSLALGLRVRPRDLPREEFALCPKPHRYMLEASFESDMRALAARYDLVVIDSFGAAARGMDENTALAREPLDILHGIAVAEDCSFLVIHHSGKTGGKKGLQDPREALRGSSAIFSAADEVLVVERRTEKVRIQHTKCRTSREIEPFFARLVDRSKPLGSKAFTVIDVDEEDAESARLTERALEKKVLDFVTKEPESTKSDVTRAVRAKRQDVAKVIDQLLEAGALTNVGSHARPKLRVAAARKGTNQEQPSSEEEE